MTTSNGNNNHFRDMIGSFCYKEQKERNAQVLILLPRHVESQYRMFISLKYPLGKRLVGEDDGDGDDEDDSGKGGGEEAKQQE